MIIRCLDIETTGLDATKDAIVEVASVDLRRDGSIISTDETLVQPGTPVSPTASAIHHLIDDDLNGAPALADVVQRFVGADAYVAHNCSFEKSFLDRHIGQAGWICTYKCALHTWPDLESYSSQALRYQLGLIDPLGIDRATLVPHRALSTGTIAMPESSPIAAPSQQRQGRGMSTAQQPRLIVEDPDFDRSHLILGGCGTCAPSDRNTITKEAHHLCMLASSGLNVAMLAEAQAPCGPMAMAASFQGETLLPVLDGFGRHFHAKTPRKRGEASTILREPTPSVTS